ncbi:MAG TPA: hypothetical protein VFE13_21025 [Caulobacteraceae bacterium]|nr:hypothetical protein [Caulobacteraceae bacterium]
MSQPDREPAEGPPPRRAPPQFVGFVLTIAMVWLGGQMLTQGVSDHFLGRSPELAVLWRGDSADAISALARLGLRGRSPGAAARLAGRALQFAPLDASALTTYGFAMDELGQPRRAEQAMAVAGRLGWRDPVTQIWLFRKGLLAGDFPDALDHGDALMRRQDVTPTPVVVALAVAARDPASIGPLAQHLAAAPPWRLPFLGYLIAQARPPETDVARALLLRLAIGPAPPTDDELAVYLRQLVGERRYAEAAVDWRLMTHRGRDPAAVYDGGFERPVGQTPFDWRMPQGVGWSATVSDAPAGGRGQALRVAYDGASPPEPVRQMTVLSPGAYRFSGRVYNDGDSDPKPLTWGIVCADDGQALGGVETPKVIGRWTTFSTDLHVPAGRCPAQWLVLSAAPGDRRGDIEVWFDDIAVVALTGVRPSPAPTG